jgi:hypothetical protein
MDTVVKLLMNILSRKFEFEAGTLPPADYSVWKQGQKADRYQNQMNSPSNSATLPSSLNHSSSCKSRI